MYSEGLEAVFTKKKIEIGDRIKIGDKEILEGVLMPRPETDNNNIIVLKLSNGYNVGVSYAGQEITKLDGHKREAFSFPKIAKTNSNELDKLSLLYTGGTIGSKIDYVTGGVYMLTKPEELLHEVPELSGIANIEVEHLMSVASEDISYVEWQSMAKHSAEALAKGAKGVVITHGTDTMHYTSAALSFMVKNPSGPIVLTGAQRSSDRGSSDAFMNLICSAKLAVKSELAEVGICMHGTSSDDYCLFIRGTRARKMHTSSRDAFKSIGEAPLAKIYVDGKIESNEKVSQSNKEKMELKTRFEPKVAMIISYPNSDPSLIEYYVKKGYKGLIIQGTGLGHAPVSTSHKEYNWIAAIKDGVASGMSIGMTSQCLYGRVNGSVYRNGRMISDLGVIYCEDMLPEVAYVKLGFLLGNYGKKEAERLMTINLSGEISERSKI